MLFRSHTTTCEELTDWWMNIVIPGIAATRNPDAPLTIGSHCRFCPNRGHCPALKNETFEFPMGIDTGHLSNEELGALLLKLDAIEGFKPILQAEALRRARQGDKIPSRKLVRMKANRAFKQVMAVPDPTDADNTIEMKLEDAITKTFGLEAYADPKMKSPAQLEKLDGGSVFVAEWAYHPDRGLTLAHEKDKRTEIRPNIERIRGRVTKIV